MTTLFAELALLPGAWARNVRISMLNGCITSVEENSQPQPSDERCRAIVPGMPNVHRHAFQRGMAGLAEVRGPSTDTFWTRREVMYRFALTIDPDQLETVAALAYIEMLESGFTRVGEFHYLHHDRDGSAYADVAEMVVRIVAASARTGIRLTLLITTPPSERSHRYRSSVASQTTSMGSPGCWRRAARPLPDWTPPWWVLLRVAYEPSRRTSSPLCWSLRQAGQCTWVTLDGIVMRTGGQQGTTKHGSASQPASPRQGVPPPSP